MQIDTMDEDNKKAELPEFFKMESFRREEYLSQLGSFTQVQYHLFHTICDFWEPILDYNQFILKSTKTTLGATTQIELLMEKLKASHIGLLQYTLVDGDLKPAHIILCEKDSPDFFYYLAEDLLARLIYEKKTPFLTIKEFETEGVSLPMDILSPLESSMLSPGFAEKKDRKTIIAVNRKLKSPLLIPSGMLEEFISSLIGHIRSEMASPNLMENLSRLAEKKISDIQKDLTQRDPSFWIMLSKTLVNHKEDIKLKIKGLNPSIFTTAHLLLTYFQNSLKEIKEKEMDTREMEKAQKDIVQDFREKGASWSHISLLDEKLKEKEEKWEDFREFFKEKAMVRGEGKEQPQLILLNNMIIHKDFLFSYFTREVGNLRNEFLFMYHDQMKELLRYNRTDKYTQFFSRSNFRSDIDSRVKEIDLMLWELLQKPTRVAESAIHYLQDIKGIKQNSRIKDALELYFHSDLVSFRSIDTMFQLKLLSLFEKAYKELGWWSRFILRITGRYDSFISMFSDLPSDNRQSRKSSRRKKKRKPYESPVTQSRTSSSHKQSDFDSDKNYSIREKRKAWAEFDDVINRSK